MRLSLLLLIFLCFSIFGKAQTVWGIKAGLNYSGVVTDNIIIVKNEAKLGWQAGIYSKSNVSGWGYWLEASINALGSRQQFGDESQKNTVGYLSLPIALQYTFNSNWSLNLGGYAAMRLWATRKSTKVGVGDFEANIKDNVAFMDYGPWANLVFSTKRIFFELRYVYGIPNINTNATTSFKASNRSGQFSIGYLIGK